MRDVRIYTSPTMMTLCIWWKDQRPSLSDQETNPFSYMHAVEVRTRERTACHNAYLERSDFPRSEVHRSQSSGSRARSNKSFHNLNSALTLIEYFRSHLCQINLSYGTGCQHPSSIEIHIHDLWHTLFLAAQVMSADSPYQDSLVVSVLHMRESMGVVRVTQKMIASSRWAAR